MINVYVQPFDKHCKIEKGTTLYTGLERAGIGIETPCGGKGICGKCRVRVDNSEEIPHTPHKQISPEEADQGVRLACLLVPETDISVHVGENFFLGGQGEPGGSMLQAQKRSTGPVDPGVEIYFQDNTWFMAWKTRDQPPVPIAWNQSFEPLGLAVDIGTTTLAVSLVSLKTGEIIGSDVSLNPQTRLGHDVLTRIQHAAAPGGLEELTGLVRGEVNRLAQSICTHVDVSVDAIIDVTIGGNTTMLELAKGIDPSPLGVVPFTVDIKGGTAYPASDFGLGVNRAAQAYIPPVLHAYVGSDISAGLVCCPEFFDDTRSVLYIDLGTNGEICLNAAGERFTTSTATGPAFEGMSISSGMRAERGAVEHVSVNNGNLVFDTIDNAPVRGVCGSGIVDFIAALLEAGMINPTGKFVTGDNGEPTNTPQPGRVVVMNDKSWFCYGKNVFLSQKDIRQIQLAKSAIKSGIEQILDRASLEPDQIDAIYLAGGFGKYLNPENMERIGMIPQGTANRLLFIGNASIDGSIQLLIDVRQRRFLEEQLQQMEHLELGSSRGFMERFVANLNF
ncbi:MAG TPA: ASKHA domain-containing protein [Desulfobacteraceae bacterium]|nr:ASKHA domain-containing protein [Desulfobacteraceae bacterium]